MKNYSLVFTLLFIASCSSFDTESFNVDLDSIYDQPNRGFLILYPLTEMEDSLRGQIVYPDLSEISDTVYAQIYFTGNNKGAVKNSVTVLVGDYSSESPSFWIDYNNDLDFKDTSNQLRFQNDFIEVSIPNIDTPEFVHTIRFFKPDSSEKSRTSKMIEQYITKGNPFAGFYFDQRRNIKVGDFVYQKDSLRIGVMDYDVNGRYSDLGSDRIVIGEYSGKINGTDEASGAVVLDSTTYFHGTSHGFKVGMVAENGNSISIKPALSEDINSKITEGQKIPNYTFKLISGESTSIYKSLEKGKFLYLNFWANWCAGCHQEVGDLKNIYTNHSDRIKLISLNYNEEVEKLNSFVEKYEISWPNGYSTSKINQELFIQGLPRNILIDGSGKIIKMNIHPSAVVTLVD